VTIDSFLKSACLAIPIPRSRASLTWDRELAELDDPARLLVSPMTVSVIANTRTERPYLPPVAGRVKNH